MGGWRVRFIRVGEGIPVDVVVVVLVELGVGVVARIERERSDMMELWLSLCCVGKVIPAS